MSNEKSHGLRYNSGKLRFDLVHPLGLEGMVKVLTMGSEKYEPRNWEKGMSWSSVIASLKRHLNAIEKGEDFDTESGLLHIDHIQCNAHFLSSYYKIAPQFDDRNHTYLKSLKIGLDIDEVICNFIDPWMKRFDIKDVPTSWFFDNKIQERFDYLKEIGELDDFYLNLKPLVDPKDIPFEPHCYVTSRPVETSITIKWLEKHGFPLRPVHTVPPNSSKLEVIKNAGVDIFVDDRFDTFRELNSNGVCCYLFDTPHNRRYNVGAKRLHSLKELV